MNIPKLGARYWIAISIASVFGANMGDFVSHVLHLGHVRGLPFLALLFAGLLLANRRGLPGGEAYYWAVIVVLRTAATNLADLMTHDLHLPYPVALLAMAAVLFLLVNPAVPEAAGRRRADLLYWATMLAAGTLGTVIGDATADALGLGLVAGSAVLIAILGIVLAWGSRSHWTGRGAYWGGIVAVRSAGTTVGDFCASRHGLGLGLPLSTACSGALLVAVLLLWRQSPGSLPEPSATLQR